MPFDEADSRVDSILVGGADFDHADAIHFFDADRGTVLSLHTRMILPPGPMTAPMNSS